MIIPYGTDSVHFSGLMNSATKCFFFNMFVIAFMFVVALCVCKICHVYIYIYIHRVFSCVFCFLWGSVVRV